MNETNEREQTTEPRKYEAPVVTDHGSLTELTLASSGSYTDGGGFGGGLSA